MKTLVPITIGFTQASPIVIDAEVSRLIGIVRRFENEEIAVLGDAVFDRGGVVLEIISESETEKGTSFSSFRSEPIIMGGVSTLKMSARFPGWAAFPPHHAPSALEQIVPPLPRNIVIPVCSARIDRALSAYVLTRLWSPELLDAMIKRGA